MKWNILAAALKTEPVYRASTAGEVETPRASEAGACSRRELVPGTLFKVHLYVVAIKLV